MLDWLFVEFHDYLLQQKDLDRLLLPHSKYIGSISELAGFKQVLRTQYLIKLQKPGIWYMTYMC